MDLIFFLLIFSSLIRSTFNCAATSPGDSVTTTTTVITTTTAVTTTTTAVLGNVCKI